MGHPSRIETLKRREQVVVMLVAGATPTEIAEKVNVSERTIMADLKHLYKAAAENSKIPEYLERLISETTFHYRRTNQELWKRYTSAPNDRDKARIMVAIEDGMMKKIDALQKLGVIRTTLSVVVNNGDDALAMLQAAKKAFKELEEEEKTFAVLD